MREHPTLSRLARFGLRMGLDRMRHFLDSMGAPHRAVPVIHVAGTNGKGSTTRLIASMLRESGYRVGEYTSPHLQHINERIHVDGRAIDDETLDALLHEVDGHRMEWAKALDGFVPIDRVLTYFELVTAAAFVHFARAEIDIAVVEVGLGGRLDATNVVEPIATAITSIGLDHVAQLGDDLAGIAGEKAGIIKANIPVVTGSLDPVALRVIRSIAHERGAPIMVHEEAWAVEPGQGGVFTWSYGDRVEHGLRVGLNGDHQVLNAGVALTVLATIADRFPIADWQHTLAGLSKAAHPGRLEWLTPDVLVDCAHNVQGAAALATYLRGLPRDRRRTLLLGASNDKDVRSMLGPLSAQVDAVMTTHCSHPRATPAGDLAQALIDVQVPVLPAGPIEEALGVASEEGGLVIVAGSVFLAGAVGDLISASS
ncbi:MAG: folylpolyglutamate synthase/dihydrofolate synthase family protein [Myxococcota bacterium]|nr:folylpolyglutamate synthase/dihydrofolate synthase family protein [Myxococcota bacterium]